MAHDTLKEPVTKEYLGEFAEQVIFPRMTDIVRDQMDGYTDKILSSNDTLGKKLDKIDMEVSASLANYDHLSRKVKWLEGAVMKLAEKSDVRLTPLDA
jgi:hypothetical protein